MRAHRPEEPFDFVQHLLDSLQHNAADIVGISLEASGLVDASPSGPDARPAIAPHAHA